MQYQRNVPVKVESLEPGVKIAGVVHEPISANGRRPGAPHGYQVGGKAPSQAAHMRYDIAPEISGGRVAVQEDDRVSLADGRVAHFSVEDRDAAARMRIGWVGRCRQGHLSVNRSVYRKAGAPNEVKSSEK